MLRLPKVSANRDVSAHRTAPLRLVEQEVSPLPESLDLRLFKTSHLSHVPVFRLKMLSIACPYSSAADSVPPIEFGQVANIR